MDLDSKTPVEHIDDASHSTKQRSLMRAIEPTPSSLIFAFAGTVIFMLFGGRTLYNGDDFWFLAPLRRDSPRAVVVDIEDQLFKISEFLQNTTVNVVLLFIFWLFIGVIVYEIIQTVLYFYFEIQDDKNLITYSKAGDVHHVPSLIVTTLKRIGVRLVFALAFAIYVALCMRIVWPALIPVFVGRLTFVTNPLDVLLAVAAFLSTMLTIHGVVVLARMVAMRTRIFT